MAKAVHLGSWFLLGCIASSAIAWLGALHPALNRVMWVIYIFCAISLVIGLITDDATRKFLKIPEPEYYALLIAIAISLILGAVTTWLIAG